MNNRNENVIIDFNYAKKQRESILSNKKTINNIDFKEVFRVPIDYILDLHISISNVSKRSRYNDLKDKHVKIIILSDLIDILNKLGDISIFLNIDLIAIENAVIESDKEYILNALFNSISSLDCKKEIARREICNRTIQLLANLINSLGFSLEEVKEYYSNITKRNISKI